MNQHTFAEILTGARLDVVNLLLSDGGDGYDLCEADLGAFLAIQLEGSEQVGLLAFGNEADPPRELNPLAPDRDVDLPGVVPVLALFLLTTEARIDAEAGEEHLQVAHPVPSDRGERDVGAFAVDHCVPFCLEHAPEIRRHSVVGRRQDGPWRPDLGAATQQLVLLYERTQDFPIQADTTDLETGILAFDVGRLRMDVREDGLQMVEDPLMFLGAVRHEFDGQRAVGPILVPSDETVALQPAGEGRLGHFPAIARGRDRLRGMRIEAHDHPWRELIDPPPFETEGTPDVMGADEMIGGG